MLMATAPSGWRSALQRGSGPGLCATDCMLRSSAPTVACMQEMGFRTLLCQTELEAALAAVKAWREYGAQADDVPAEFLAAGEHLQPAAQHSWQLSAVSQAQGSLRCAQAQLLVGPWQGQLHLWPVLRWAAPGGL